MSGAARAIAAIAVTAGLGVWNTPPAHAQSGALKFEVASIRPGAGDSGFRNPDCSGDRFIVAGLHFNYVLQWAYDVRGVTAGTAFLQRVPLPMRQTTYDMQAKADRPFTSESQCRLMVQALLTDRFKLAFHYEQRDVELFDLVVASGGAKLRQALPTDQGTDINFVINGFTHKEAPIEDADTRAHTKGVTMQELAQWLPTPEPVADKTGLGGRYKIDLRISTSLGAGLRDTAQDAAEDPPLDAALAKLGLRLEKRKASVKVPVLDHIEAPDTN
jgi:uncharacterized protein (TIGR03435 family)